MENVKLVEPRPTGLAKAQVDAYADLVRKALGLNVGDPLEPVVEALGGKIDYGWSADEQNGGSIVARSRSEFVIYLSAFTAPIRDRFTIAHELGHLFLHLNAIKNADPEAVMRATRSVDPTDKQQQRAEWEANWFAAALLMPASEFTPSLINSDEYNAAKFNVSKKAAAVRRSSLNP